jgi:hypothetical protein
MRKCRYAVLLALAWSLSGCMGTGPVVDKTRIAPPKSVAIVEPPRMRNAAAIGIFSDWNAQPDHFSPAYDKYFALDGVPPAGPDSLPDYARQVGEQHLQQAALQPAPSVGMAAAGGAVAGLMGAAIQASAEDTMKKAAQFDKEVTARVPGYDLRADLVQALAASMRERGVAVTIVKDSAGTGTGPRLRWPVSQFPGKAVAAAQDFPAVDADLLLQLSPVAIWNAPGPMNNFRRAVSIAVVIYNGRTKEYLGTQAFWFNNPAWQHEYTRYETLVADSPAAAATMREAVLSLVPQIVDAVNVPPAKGARQGG